METPHGTHAISENTNIRAPLGRVVALVVGLIVLVATFTGAYFRLLGRFEAHLADTSIHLNPEFHAGHGRPVGSFDFGIAVQQITTKLDALDKKPAGTVCTPRPGGKLVCEPTGRAP
jgi:hypothetical protein